jgi:hypothetical protein
MSNQHRYVGTDDTEAGSGRVQPTARQRWTRALVIFLVITVLITLLVLHLTGAVGAGTMG